MTSGPTPAAEPVPQSLWYESVEKIREIGVEFFDAAPNIVIGLIIFVGFWLAGRTLRSAMRRFAVTRRKHHNLAIVLGRLAQGGMVLIGLLVAAVIVFPTFTPAKLIEVLGLTSVAVGFAFRDILQNYLAGILLLITEPFRIGDQILHDKYEGTVEQIQTRATFIRTYDGRRVVIPNSELFTHSVTVNTAFDTRRVEYDIGIGFGDEIEHAREIVIQTLRAQPEVLATPAPDCLVIELGASSIVLRARWWITPSRRADVLESRDRVLPAIKTALVRAGIDLPFPTQQLLFHDQTEEGDGDRSRQREGWPAGTAGPTKPGGVAAAVRDLADAVRSRPGNNGTGAG